LAKKHAHKKKKIVPVTQQEKKAGLKSIKMMNRKKRLKETSPERNPHAIPGLV